MVFFEGGNDRADENGSLEENRGANTEKKAHFEVVKASRERIWSELMSE